MAREIERRFLVNLAQWTHDPSRGERYRQGYLCTDPARVVRVRTFADQAFITVKSQVAGIERLEFELPIARDAANAILDRVCIRPIIEKARFHETFAGFTWDVDVFAAENSGLVIAEVELPEANVPAQLPPWIGREISTEPKYLNANLALRPFSQWPSDERAER